MDAESQPIVSEKWLTDWKGEHPPRAIVRVLSLSPGGRRASFRICNRQTLAAGFEQRAIECGPMKTVALDEAVAVI